MLQEEEQHLLELQIFITEVEKSTKGKDKLCLRHEIIETQGVTIHDDALQRHYIKNKLTLVKYTIIHNITMME